MSWVDDLNEHIQHKGKNTDARFFIGVITSVTPLVVAVNDGVVGAAEWTTSAANEAAVGERAVLVQDMATRTFIVLGRLI